MSERGLCIKTDVGSVSLVDEPPGITWLSFGGVALGPEYPPLEGDRVSGEVPVSTAELEEIKGSEVYPRDAFWAIVNIAATSQGDVNPVVKSFVPEPTEDQLRAFGWYRDDNQ